MTQEIFFFKNHTPKVVETLVPDPFIRNQNWSYLVCIGVSTPSLKNTTPIRELPNHPFLGDPTLHIGFSWIPHPLKNHIFQWNPKILTLSYLLKETKFIVKIFQFAFLVWQRKYFCLDTSLSLNISKIEILLKLNIAFLSSRFFYLTKKSGEKCKYL